MSKHREQNVRIISIGRDSNALALRQARLQLAGYEVWSAASLHLALAFIRHERCGILLLHSSLPEYWLHVLIRNFRRSCPNGRVIGIADQATALRRSDLDEIVLESHGTAVLLKAITGQEEGIPAA